jgi:hypothetical protein
MALSSVPISQPLQSLPASTEEPAQGARTSESAAGRYHTAGVAAHGAWKARGLRDERVMAAGRQWSHV